MAKKVTLWWVRIFIYFYFVFTLSFIVESYNALVLIYCLRKSHNLLFLC